MILAGWCKQIRCRHGVMTGLMNLRLNLVGDVVAVLTRRSDHAAFALMNQYPNPAENNLLPGLAVESSVAAAQQEALQMFVRARWLGSRY